MGGVFGGGFSKSKQSASSESGNNAYPFLQESLGGAVGGASSASDLIGQLLGTSGSGGAGQNQAFQNFRDNSGYDFILNQGSDAITNNRAAKGLLNSGSTLKALNNYGQQTANSSIGDYIKQLLGLGQLGTGAAGVLSDAGKYSEAQSKGSSFAANLKVG